MEQNPEGLAGLSHRARGLGALSLSLVPPLTSYPGPLPGVASDAIVEMLNDSLPTELGLKGKHQASNASLALQLCFCWLSNQSSNSKPVSGGGSGSAVISAAPFPLTQAFQDGGLEVYT